MTRNRIAIFAAALALGAAPLAPAMAYNPDRQTTPTARVDVGTTGSLYGEAFPAERVCGPSSAAEGNADQQTRFVKQYGQTSGGTRC